MAYRRRCSCVNKLVTVIALGCSKTMLIFSKKAHCQFCNCLIHASYQNWMQMYNKKFLQINSTVTKLEFGPETSRMSLDVGTNSVLRQHPNIFSSSSVHCRAKKTTWIKQKEQTPRWVQNSEQLSKEHFVWTLKQSQRNTKISLKQCREHTAYKPLYMRKLVKTHSVTALICLLEMF